MSKSNEEHVLLLVQYPAVEVLLQKDSCVTQLKKAEVQFTIKYMHA